MQNSSMFRVYSAILLLLLTVSPAARAVDVKPFNFTALLDNSGRRAYQDFLQSTAHRAFFIAPGGTWGWKGDQLEATSAIDAAARSCRNEAEQPCLPYAVDNQVVFDAKAWATQFAPYQNHDQAANSPIGVQRGYRFYDLVFRSASGNSMKLSDLRGKAVVLHFWGSWCPSCLREIPGLEMMYQAIKTSPDVQFVLLQVREKFDVASRWAQSQHFTLPLFDSGAHGISWNRFLLANGETLLDRNLAAAFPTTYILDKHGIVVFSHTGPISGWPEYLPILEDIAQRSGK